MALEKMLPIAAVLESLPSNANFLQELERLWESNFEQTQSKYLEFKRFVPTYKAVEDVKSSEKTKSEKNAEALYSEIEKVL